MWWEQQYVRQSNVHFGELLLKVKTSDIYYELNVNEIPVWLQWCFCCICWFITENTSLMKRPWSGLLQISAGMKQKVLCTQENYHCTNVHSSSDVCMSLLLRHFDVNICLVVNIFVNKALLAQQFWIMQQFSHIVSSLYCLFCLIWHYFQTTKPIIHQCVSNRARFTERIVASLLVQDVVFVVLIYGFDLIKHIMMQILVSHSGVLANDVG